MAAHSSHGGAEERVHRWLDPVLNTLSPRHIELFRRYQKARIFVDFGAAACFVAGSVLFFYPRDALMAARLFLIGSVLFAVKPTLDLVRAFHLSKIDSGGKG